MDDRPENLLRRLLRWYVAMYKATPVSLPPSGCDALDAWINAATTDLATDGRLRVANEIAAHFNFERDARIAQGLHEDAAERTALQQLGPAHLARRRFNASYLTYLDEHRIAFLTGNRPIRTRVVRWHEWLCMPLFWSLLGCISMLVPGPPHPSFYWVLMAAIVAPRFVGGGLYLCLGERMLRDIMFGIALLQGTIALAFIHYLATRALPLLATDANPLAWIFPSMVILMLPVLALLTLRAARKLPESKGPVQS